MRAAALLRALIGRARVGRDNLYLQTWQVDRLALIDFHRRTSRAPAASARSTTPNRSWNACAPISLMPDSAPGTMVADIIAGAAEYALDGRSEERRVGKEGRSRRAA